jgi:hypothetical protein
MMAAEEAMVSEVLWEVLWEDIFQKYRESIIPPYLRAQIKQVEFSY